MLNVFRMLCFVHLNWEYTMFRFIWETVSLSVSIKHAYVSCVYVSLSQVHQSQPYQTYRHTWTCSTQTLALTFLRRMKHLLILPTSSRHHQPIHHRLPPRLPRCLLQPRPTQHHSPLMSHHQLSF